MKSPLGRLEIEPLNITYQDKIAELILQYKPEIVVETGLLSGLGAEFILHALDTNKKGRLFSIDPFDEERPTNGQGNTPTVYTKNPIVHPRFKWIRKRSDEALEPLFKKVGPFDVFIHDSDHSFECQSYEYDAAWRMVRSGGIIASDDIYWGTPPHGAWEQFITKHGVKANIAGNAQWFIKP